MFAGNQVQAAPYDSSGNYAGDSGTNSVTFSNGNQVQTNFDGQSIFGDTSSGLIGDADLACERAQQRQSGGGLSRIAATADRAG